MTLVKDLTMMVKMKAGGQLIEPLWAKLREGRERFVPAGTLRGRFAGAVFWSFVGTAVSNFAGLVMAIIMARIMGREGYGEVGVIISTYGIFSQLGGLGLGVTAVKYAAQLRNTRPFAVGSLLGTLLTLGAVSYALSGIAVAYFAPSLAALLNRSALVGPIRLSSLLLPLQGIDSIQLGILAGFESFRKVARVNILRIFVNLPLNIAGAYFLGLTGVILAMIVAGCFTLMLNRKAVNEVLENNAIRLRYGIAVSKLTMLWQFSLPAFISGCLPVVSNWIVNAMLVNQRGGYMEMGLYNAAYQWRALAILVPGVCNSAVLSIQANLHAANDDKNHRNSVRGNLILQCLAAGLVVGVLAGMSSWIVRVYGKEYKNASEVLVILAIGWFFLTPNWILWNALISKGKVWWGLLFNTVGTAALLSIAYQLGQAGARGIALAFLYAGMIQVGLQSFYYFSSARNGPARIAR